MAAGTPIHPHEPPRVRLAEFADHAVDWYPILVAMATHASHGTGPESLRLLPIEQAAIGVRNRTAAAGEAG